MKLIAREADATRRAVTLERRPTRRNAAFRAGFEVLAELVALARAAEARTRARGGATASAAAACARTGDSAAAACAASARAAHRRARACAPDSGLSARACQRAGVAARSSAATRRLPSTARSAVVLHRASVGCSRATGEEERCEADTESTRVQHESKFLHGRSKTGAGSVCG